MRFELFDHAKEESFPIGRDKIVLRRMMWNDWWEFRTMFHMYYLDAEGDRRDVGSVKIANVDQEYGENEKGETLLPRKFQRLSDRYVSVGQDDSYYSNLNGILGPNKAHIVLRALGDLAINPARFEEVRGTRVLSNSLMRGISPVTVTETFSRIARGIEDAVAYSFSFVQPSKNPLLAEKPLKLKFEVRPEYLPPTNVHVLIGRNGSGKTTLLASMARVMLGSNQATEGRFVSHQETQDSGIANLVYVAFSAFDQVEVPVHDSPIAYSRPYSYIGLQHLSDENNAILDENPESQEPPEWKKYTRPAEELADEFANSAWAVASGKSLALWREALEILEADPNFDAADVSKLADFDRAGVLNAREYKKKARNLYAKRLSSGHKIVLLTITRLVETVTERTLVLLDEPEGHLHPPLLSAFTRALSDLLKRRNGVAIVATHSPVILQEVPRRSVYSISRSGTVVRATRPSEETFGEDVGSLTHAVFGLEVQASGFNRMVIDAAQTLGSYSAVVEHFNDELGFEAKALLRSWFAVNSPRPRNRERFDLEDAD